MFQGTDRNGFTLVELSIVLVILGLLVGGVLAGQSLIHAAELRAVTREYNGYQTALNTFRDKYFALPGDMPNAVRYWGAAAGASDDGINYSCATLNTPSTSAATCNGDGNGKYDDWLNYGYFMEMFRAWQHLANAGLIEGTYAGINAYTIKIGYNVPKSKLPNAGWSWMYDQWPNTTRSINYLQLGGNASALNNPDPVLKPEDAYNIDRKLDDGVADRGKIVALTYSAVNCSSGADYTLTTTTIGCPLRFDPGAN